MTANLQQYRLEGNRLFQLKKYEEAIKQYTKAIVSNNFISPLFKFSFVLSTMIILYFLMCLLKET